jgi:hypothetical protein
LQGRRREKLECYRSYRSLEAIEVVEVWKAKSFFEVGQKNLLRSKGNVKIPFSADLINKTTSAATKI